MQEDVPKLKKRKAKYEGSSPESYQELSAALKNPNPSKLANCELPITQLELINIDLAQERIIKMDMAKLMEQFEHSKGVLEKFLKGSKYPHLHSFFRITIDKIESLEKSLAKHIQDPTNNSVTLIKIGSQIQDIEEITISLHHSLSYLREYTSQINILMRIKNLNAKVFNQGWESIYNGLYDDLKEIAKKIVKISCESQFTIF